MPKGQEGKEYDIAVKGTQNTMNNKSATAKLMIRMLVVLRMCLRINTTPITRELPTRPMITIKLCARRKGIEVLGWWVVGVGWG